MSMGGVVVLKWLFYSLIALLSWGLWGVVLKYASRWLSWQQLYVFSSMATLTMATLILLTAGKRITSVNPYYALLAFVAGFAGAVGYVSMVRALESGGEASVVIPLTSLYPAVTVVLAWLLLGEKLTVSKILGLILVLVAAYLLSKG